MARQGGFEEAELFQKLGFERLSRIRPHLEIVPYRPHESLYLEGQPAEYLWIVRSGEVRTVKGSRSGRVMTLEHLRPGDLFGVTSLLNAASYSDAAEGMIEGEVWRLPGRVVLEHLRDEHDLLQDLLAVIARRLEKAHDRLCSFAHDSVPARISRLLLAEPDSGKIAVTRRALSEEAGTRVETTIRVLRSFERSGWVEGGIGWVRVIDREALTRIANGEKPES